MIPRTTGLLVLLGRIDVIRLGNVQQSGRWANTMNGFGVQRAANGVCGTTGYERGLVTCEILWLAVSWYAVLCNIMLCCAMLCCIMLYSDALRCSTLCCAKL